MRKSPLRYPGGKSKALKYLLDDSRLPETISEYREPFLGGGSVAIEISKRYPHLPVWVNDKYKHLWNFWTILQESGQELTDRILELKHKHPDIDTARTLFDECKQQLNDILTMPSDAAIAFYVVNKCSFSGLTENSSFSKLASERNFTLSNIASLAYYSTIIQNWRITNLNYTELLKDTTENTFLFLDPPYDLKKDYTMSGTDGDKLYGKKGAMHSGFNHVRRR